MENLFVEYNNYVKLHVVISAQLELLKKSPIKLGFYCEPQQLKKLFQIDQEMKSKKYIRYGSKYINSINGHIVRFNKLSYLNISTNSLVFKKDMDYISNVVLYNQRVSELSRKEMLVHTNKRTIENTIIELLKRKELKKMFKNSSEYIDSEFNSAQKGRFDLFREFKETIESLLIKNNIIINEPLGSIAINIDGKINLIEDGNNKEYDVNNFYCKIYELSNNNALNIFIFNIMQAYILKKEFNNNLLKFNKNGEE
jgi:hypothetical protein